MLNDTVILVTDGVGPFGKTFAPAEAAAPGCPRQTAGVAPGEKPHGLAASARASATLREPWPPL